MITKDIIIRDERGDVAVALTGVEGETEIYEDDGQLVISGPPRAPAETWMQSLFRRLCALWRSTP